MNIEDGVLSTLIPVDASVNPYSLFRVVCRHNILVMSSIQLFFMSDDIACNLKKVYSKGLLKNYVNHRRG